MDAGSHFPDCQSGRRGKNGSGGWTRTNNLRINSPSRYQLRHAGASQADRSALHVPRSLNCLLSHIARADVKQVTSACFSRLMGLFSPVAFSQRAGAAPEVNAAPETPPRPRTSLTSPAGKLRCSFGPQRGSPAEIAKPI